MSTYNPFRTESNGDYWAPRVGRPSRSNPAFANLSDDALTVAQEWFDQAEADQKSREEVKARTAQWETEHPEELEAMRRQYRAQF